MSDKNALIENPAVHAGEKFNTLFVQDEYMDKWGDDASYCTTSQFASLDRGYVKHCGPTAVTNVLISFFNKRGQSFPENEIFLRVADLGMKKRIYWNTDFMKMFGGTFDHKARSYIKAALKEFDLDGITVMRGRRATEKNFMKCLKEGGLAYLELRFDKPYGSHHVVCYGYSFVKSPETGQRRMYLKIADGWSHTPRYMESKDMMLNSFVPVVDPAG